MDAKMDAPGATNNTKAEAEMFADLRAAKLVIQEGATFVGGSELNPDKVAPTPAPQPRPGEATRLTAPAKAAGV